MSDKEEYNPTVKEELVLRVLPGGETIVEFFPVSFSGLLIDYVLGKEDRERLAQTGCRKIYCG